MTMSLPVAAVVLVASLAALGWLIFEVIPSLARDRLALELLSLEDQLESLVDASPGVAQNRGVVTLASAMRQLIIHGEPLGLSSFTAAWLRVKRDGHVSRAPDFTGLTPAEQAVCRAIARRFAWEVLRAAFFVSRIWFFAVPFWLLTIGRRFPKPDDVFVAPADEDLQDELFLDDLVVIGVRSSESWRPRTQPIPV